MAGLIAQGLTNRQLAERLVITQPTVAAHIEHILEKLGLRSRLQIGLWAAHRQITTAVTPGGAGVDVFGAGAAWVNAPGLNHAEGNTGQVPARVAASLLLPEGAPPTTLRRD